MKVLRFIIGFVLGYVISVGFVFALQWTYYNYIDQYQLPFITEPIPVLNQNNEVAIGDPILLGLKVSKPELVPLVDNSVDITCTDGNLITLAPSNTAGTLPVGVFEFVSDSYFMPDKAAPGSICQFNIVNTYEPNPYKIETITWSSEQFKVIEGQRWPTN